VFSRLGASFEILDLRTKWLRVTVTRSRGMTTDYGSLNRAIPFLHRLGDRSKLSVVLSGAARFDACERSIALRGGDLVSSESRAGTETHMGDLLTVEWRPSALGADQRGKLDVRPLASMSHGRFVELASRLEVADRVDAILELLDLLRLEGFAIAPVSAVDLFHTDRETTELQLLQDALSERLNALHEFPTIEEVGEMLGWGQRQVHRRLARLRETHGVVWRHWREFVHQARMLRAMQLLSAPAATTELVARLSGFRSPSALCHAFAKARLPSPGRFATNASTQSRAAALAA
jgi:AraC-like DNA-binding protein